MDGATRPTGKQCCTGSSFTLDLAFSDNDQAGYARIKLEDPGQQPGVDNNRRARQQRGHKHHAVKDDRLRRHRSNLPLTRHEGVPLNISYRHRTGVTTAHRPTVAGARITKRRGQFGRASTPS